MYLLKLKVDGQILYEVRNESLRKIVYFARSLVRYYAHINKYGQNEYKDIYAFIYDDLETLNIYCTIGSIFADEQYAMFRPSDCKFAIIRRRLYG